MGIRDDHSTHSRRRGGPATEAGKKRSSGNSWKHGLFAKSVKFQTEEESEWFDTLLADTCKQYHVEGELERNLAYQVARCMWNLAQAESLLERQARANRRHKTAQALAKFLHNSALPEVPLPGIPAIDGVSKSTISPVDCQEIRIRLRHTVPERSASEKEQEDGQMTEVEATLGNSFEQSERYVAMASRSLDRALERLRRQVEFRKRLNKEES